MFKGKELFVCKIISMRLAFFRSFLLSIFLCASWSVAAAQSGFKKADFHFNQAMPVISETNIISSEVLGVSNVANGSEQTQASMTDEQEQLTTSKSVAHSQRLQNQQQHKSIVKGLKSIFPLKSDDNTAKLDVISHSEKGTHTLDKNKTNSALVNDNNQQEADVLNISTLGSIQEAEILTTESKVIAEPLETEQPVIQESLPQPLPLPLLNSEQAKNWDGVDASDVTGAHSEVLTNSEKEVSIEVPTSDEINTINQLSEQSTVVESEFVSKGELDKKEDLDKNENNVDGSNAQISEVVVEAQEEDKDPIEEAQAAIEKDEQEAVANISSETANGPDSKSQEVAAENAPAETSLPAIAEAQIENVLVDITPLDQTVIKEPVVEQTESSANTLLAAPQQAESDEDIEAQTELPAKLVVQDTEQLTQQEVLVESKPISLVNTLAAESGEIKADESVVIEVTQPEVTQVKLVDGDENDFEQNAKQLTTSEVPSNKEDVVQTTVANTSVLSDLKSTEQVEEVSGEASSESVVEIVEDKQEVVVESRVQSVEVELETTQNKQDQEIQTPELVNVELAKNVNTSEVQLEKQQLSEVENTSINLNRRPRAQVNQTLLAQQATEMQFSQEAVVIEPIADSVVSNRAAPLVEIQQAKQQVTAEDINNLYGEPVTKSIPSHASDINQLNGDNAFLESYVSSFSNSNFIEKKPYHLSSGDVLDIDVFQAAEFSNTYRVDLSGRIAIPLIGVVRVGGLTPLEAEGMLERKLGAEYLQNPQVRVFVKEHNSIKIPVLGSVRTPKVLTPYEPKNIIEALSLAGGLSDTASNFIHLKVNLWDAEQNAKQEKTLVLNINQLMAKNNAINNLYLQSGDSIYVPEAGAFYVVGGIRQPGGYPISHDTTLLKAVSKAGGALWTADVNKIDVVRNVPGQGLVKKTYSLKDIENQEAKDVTLMEGDVVIVDHSKFRRAVAAFFKEFRFGIGLSPSDFK